MATSILQQPGVGSPKPAIPFPQPAPAPAKPEVSQAQLAQVLTIRGQIAEIEKQLEQAEAQVRASLESGYSVEPGLLKAWLKTAERRSVAWKAVCERELGDDYCRRVLAATKPDTFTNLVVTA